MSQNNPTTQRNSGRSHECAESADTKDLSTPLCDAKWHRVFIPNATLSAALERARAAAAELTQQLASVQEASGQDDEPGSPSQNSNPGFSKGSPTRRRARRRSSGSTEPPWAHLRPRALLSPVPPLMATTRPPPSGTLPRRSSIPHMNASPSTPCTNSACGR